MFAMHHIPSLARQRRSGCPVPVRYYVWKQRRRVHMICLGMVVTRLSRPRDAMVVARIIGRLFYGDDVATATPRYAYSRRDTA